MFINSKRWRHFAAMALIGDGVMALVRPQHDARAWSTGPKPWRSLMNNLHDNPALTRAIGAAQIAGGILWALHQEKLDPAQRPSD
jgi:hypothetical protein